MTLFDLQTHDRFTLTDFPELGEIEVVRQTGTTFVPVRYLNPRVKLRPAQGKEHCELWRGRTVTPVTRWTPAREVDPIDDQLTPLCR